ncbi:MAG: ATPase [Rhodobacteraceae bacterium]|nr:ATPase [Paracoccaceae bacterium]
MSGWTAKRFWQAAQAEPCEGGFTVRLDGRGVKTPAKAPLVVPTLAMAQAIAAEWEAQQGAVRPETMPVTRAANSALDKVVPQRAEVVALLAAYGGSDLLCYRAAGPEALAERQAAGWDPLLDWAAESFGARLAVTRGVMPVAQDPAGLARLEAEVAGLSVFRLAGFHDLVAISGSLVLALAVIRGRLGAEEAWHLSRIDEAWQVEQWGEDEEAAAAEVVRRVAFDAASRFYALCG